MSGQPPRSLVKKLAAIMAAVDRIPKNGYNEHFRYHFAQESDVLEALRKELAARHVICLPAIVGQQRIEIGKTSSGAIKALTEVEMEFTFYDGESGEELTRRWRGVGVDTEDKGLYKATTGGEKYWLLKAFLIPTGDDPEATTSDRASASQQPAARRAGPQQRPATARPAASTVPPLAGAPDGAPFTVADVRPKEKGSAHWTEITFSTGEVVVALDLKVINDATRFKQDKTPVEITTTVNEKRKVILTAIRARDAQQRAAS